MSSIGLGLVGLGSWGLNYLLTIIQLADIDLVAVHDVDPLRFNLPALARIEKTRHLDEMLSLPGIDGVVISTPDHTHHALALRCLEAGFDVLVEKPMTRNASQARELHDTALSLCRILAVGHIMLYHPAYLALREELLDGKPDRITGISSTRTSSGPHGRVECDVLSDLACHDIAMAVALKGEPVAARSNHLGSPGRAASYELMFKDETTLTGRVAWDSTPPTRVFGVHLDGRVRSLDQHLPPKTETEDTPLGRQCRDFADCCRTRQEPASGSRLGLLVMKSLDAIRESMQYGGSWVTMERQAVLS